jgi:hypothetical protein
MFDGPTWGANLEQWPWFGGAAAVFLVAVGMLIAVKPKSKGPSKTNDTSSVRKDWTSTGRIDFADCQPVAGLVLQVEETRTCVSPSGVEHHETRWRRGTLPEAKTVLVSYHAQRYLAMSPTFTVSAATGTKRKENGEGERIVVELADVANKQNMVEATPIPQDVQH